MKAWKEAECQRAEEEVRWKAEEEAEEEAWRRVEAEANVHVEEIAWVQSLVVGPSKGKQSKVAASGAGRGPSPMLWMLRCQGGVQDEAGEFAANTVEEVGGSDVAVGWEEEGTYNEEAEEEDKEAEEEDKEAEEAEKAEEAEEYHDMLGVLMVVFMAVVTEMQNMAMDRRCAAVESCMQTEQMLGILKEIWGCLDLKFIPKEPEVGSEEDFEEEEVVEAGEALNGWSEEVVEVDESV
ncbi:hypothetical protein PAXRUDRAFT_15964 [Paxillus rubicundulus Ve08.2h10]|uniref:Uncharacterized protein n=1 Tax=Paxillus rubicundulus Ve08.2h10 TaxID=930991 RepID=A0A0D0D8N2_9AGAM|nr:hypothetical protein PAXRUDRAFT_15964 [Paxillus rubicundulus Ve08.2h10]